MQELLTIPALAVAVMLLLWDLYLGLGYTETAWSGPTPPKRYAYLLQEVADHEYVR